MNSLPQLKSLTMRGRVANASWVTFPHKVTVIDWRQSGGGGEEFR